MIDVWLVREGSVFKTKAERVDEYSVWVHGTRFEKKGRHDEFFDSFDEAYANALKFAQNKLKDAEDELWRAKELVNKLKSLTNDSVMSVSKKFYGNV